MQPDDSALLPPDQADLNPDDAAWISSDEFRMHHFKITLCSKQSNHDWNFCPFAHPGERACRRDPSRYNYTSITCLEMLQRGTCSQGDACGAAHSVFEFWLHPHRYRTEMCKVGAGCNRRICFFAHKPEELRPLPDYLQNPDGTTGGKYSLAAALPGISLQQGSAADGLQTAKVQKQGRKTVVQGTSNSGSCSSCGSSSTSIVNLSGAVLGSVVHSSSTNSPSGVSGNWLLQAAREGPIGSSSVLGTDKAPLGPLYAAPHVDASVAPLAAAHHLVASSPAMLGYSHASGAPLAAGFMPGPSQLQAPRAAHLPFGQQGVAAGGIAGHMRPSQQVFVHMQHDQQQPTCSVVGSSNLALSLQQPSLQGMTHSMTCAAGSTVTPTMEQATTMLGNTAAPVALMNTVQLVPAGLQQQQQQQQTYPTGLQQHQLYHQPGFQHQQQQQPQQQLLPFDDACFHSLDYQAVFPSGAADNGSQQMLVGWQARINQHPQQHLLLPDSACTLVTQPTASAQLLHG